MRRRAVAILLAFCACTSGPAPDPDARGSPTSPATLPTATAGSGFTLLGHDPLFSRGMNSGLAVRSPYAYVGNRTDASQGHRHPGVLIVDVGRPAAPRVVGEIPGSDEGTSSRELRIWPEQDTLIVLELRCGASTHACRGSGAAGLRFYDIRGERATRPRLLVRHPTAFEPHEMFLWVDRSRPGRALLYVTTDTAGDDAVGLVVLDVSGVRAGRVEEVARWSGNRELGGRLHSIAVSADGRRASLAHLGGGFAMLDTTDLARGELPATLTLLTAPSRALRWSPGPHSAVPIGETGYVLTTDEVYGGGGACPWGWVRLIDASDPSRPRLAGELRTAFNRPQACANVPRSAAYSYSSHAPTVVGDLALISWHGAGLVAAGVAGPRITMRAAFVPEPLSRVDVEDPRLTAGPLKVAVWSTPVVADGLVYVVDLRNGLYVLRYEGAGQGALRSTRFGEGNSNVG